VTQDASSGRYGAWQRLSGIHVADDPAVVSATPGQLDLFALGTDGLLYRRTMSGGLWNQWYMVDQRTKFDAAPAAASSAPGRIDLVGRTGGDLVTASLVDDRWNAWAVVPTAGRITAAPGLLSSAPGTLDAFVVRKADGAVLRLPYAGGVWLPTQVIGRMAAAGRPEPVSYGGRLYLIAPANGGGLTEAVSPAGAADASADPTDDSQQTSPVVDWTVSGLPAGAGGAVGAVGDEGLSVWIRTPSGGLARAVAT
jgi:hypothetical protein